MGWLIFAGILFLLAAVLMIPVHIKAVWKEKVSVELRFLFFFKKTLYPAEKKEKKEKKKKKETEEKTEQKPKQKPKKRILPEEIVDGIIKAVDHYGPGAKMILRNLRVHELEGFWKVAAEDAASCAIRYGSVCALLHSALGFFRNLTRIEKTKLRIFPDFTAEKEEIWVKADMEANPLTILIGLLRVGVVFLKDKFQKETKKRKPSRAGKKPAKIIEKEQKK